MGLYDNGVQNDFSQYKTADDYAKSFFPLSKKRQYLPGLGYKTADGSDEREFANRENEWYDWYINQVNNGNRDLLTGYMGMFGTGQKATEANNARLNASLDYARELNARHKKGDALNYKEMDFLSRYPHKEWL